MELNLQIQSKESEDYVIGAMLLESSCVPIVVNILRAECFYNIVNREVFKAIKELDRERKAVDLVTVVQELMRISKIKDIGGPAAVSEFTMKVATADHAEHHSKIIYEYFVLRELGKISMKILNLVQEPAADSLEIMNIAQRELSSIDYISKSNVRQVGDVVMEIIEENKSVIETGVKPGISHGLQNIDVHFRKQKQELIIIAARPGMGKTAFMLANAKHTAMELKLPVMIFSLEMSTSKLVGRLIASETQVSSKHINQKTITLEQLKHIGANVTKLLDIQMYFDDTPALEIYELRSKIRRAKRELGVVEFYIDYLQLMGGERKGNREQEISFISRTLKTIAKEEDVPITALCQLSRAVEGRNDKKPNLSDLRESGAIEQDADVVMFIMRPEYYGIEDNNGLYDGTTFFGGKHLPAKNLMIAELAKYREGALFQAPLKFYGEWMRVENYDMPTSSQFPGLIANESF